MARHTWPDTLFTRTALCAKRWWCGIHVQNLARLTNKKLSSAVEQHLSVLDVVPLPPFAAASRPEPDGSVRRVAEHKSVARGWSNRRDVVPRRRPPVIDDGFEITGRVSTGACECAHECTVNGCVESESHLVCGGTRLARRSVATLGCAPGWDMRDGVLSATKKRCAPCVRVVQAARHSIGSKIGATLANGSALQCDAVLSMREQHNSSALHA